MTWDQYLIGLSVVGFIATWTFMCGLSYAILTNTVLSEKEDKTAASILSAVWPVLIVIFVVGMLSITGQEVGTRIAKRWL